LRAKLRLAIRRARQNHARVTITGMQVERNGCSIRVSITAQPVECDTGGLLLVSFVDDLKPELRRARPVETAKDASRVPQLERELEATREDLQSVIRDLNVAHEEQKATSEEAVAFNEHFQSTNEELTALNSQLHEMVEQQRTNASDLQSILNSTDVATLFLDADLSIRFFTPAAKSLFNIIASDVSRPLADLTRRFEDEDLLPDARAVLAGHAPIRREVKAEDGAWFMRGMLPYRSDHSSIEGWSSRLPALPR
jgi:two-component system CheB/CheR fusion protein